MVKKGVDELSPVGKPNDGSGGKRCGPWTDAEVAYATRLSDDFKAGVFPDVPNGIPLRKWLSEKLNCTPMRLSKKFDKTSGVLGMCRYTCNVLLISSLTGEKFKRRKEHLAHLEAAFRQAVLEEESKLSEFNIQQMTKQQLTAATSSTKKRKKSGSAAPSALLTMKRAKTAGSTIVGGYLNGPPTPQDTSMALVPNQADLSVGFLLLELQKSVPSARVE